MRKFRKCTSHASEGFDAFYDYVACAVGGSCGACWRSEWCKQNESTSTQTKAFAGREVCWFALLNSIASACNICVRFLIDLVPWVLWRCSMMGGVKTKWHVAMLAHVVLEPWSQIVTQTPPPRQALLPARTRSHRRYVIAACSTARLLLRVLPEASTQVRAPVSRVSRAHKAFEQSSPRADPSTSGTVLPPQSPL